MNDTITTELRGLLADINWTEIIDHMQTSAGAVVDGDWLDAWHEAASNACDAIDAVHANLEAENESLRRELDRVLGEQEGRDGLIELPKDMNDEYIHVGDVMEGEKVGGGFCEPFEVVGYIMSNGELEPMNEYKCPSKSRYLRHHHAPTVEDVLREFAVEVCGESALTIRSGVVEEYASRLRLAGES